MATGSVKVHWCPNCRSWFQRAAGTRLISLDPSRRYRLGAVEVDCLHEEHQCGKCEAEFVTLRTTTQDSSIYARLILEPAQSLLESGFCGVSQEGDDPFGNRALA